MNAILSVSCDTQICRLNLEKKKQSSLTSQMNVLSVCSCQTVTLACEFASGSTDMLLLLTVSYVLFPCHCANTVTTHISAALFGPLYED